MSVIYADVRWQAKGVKNRSTLPERLIIFKLRGNLQYKILEIDNFAMVDVINESKYASSIVSCRTYLYEDNAPFIACFRKDRGTNCKIFISRDLTIHKYASGSLFDTDTLVFYRGVKCLPNHYYGT